MTVFQKASYIEGAFPTSWEYLNENERSNIEEYITDLRITYKYFSIHRLDKNFDFQDIDKNIEIIKINNLQIGHYSTNTNSIVHFFIFAINDQTKIAIAGNDLISIKYLAEKIKFYNKPDESIFSIYYKFKTPDGSISTYEIDKPVSDFLDTKEFYYPYFDIDKMMRLYIESTENILILSGEPGTGKTSFIKLLYQYFPKYITKSDFKVIFVKDKDVLSSDMFWGELITGKIDLVIMDDLDESLTPREISTYITPRGEEKEGNPFVEKFLSVSDGVFNIRTKFIITTNRKIDAIDSAILRPGRCFDVISMRYLTRKESLNIWLNNYELTEEQFDFTFGKTEFISPAILKSQFDRVASKDSSYLLEEGLSIRSSFLELNYKEKNKIGFKMQ